MLRATGTHRIARMLATAALAAFAAPTLSSAQTVAYAGFTNGCFGVACTPVANNVFQTAVLGGLTYENSTFSGQTLGGFAAIGNFVNAQGVREVDNLGAFYLRGVPTTNYNGQVFTLLVSFTAPGSANQIFSAALTGRVSVHNGGIFFDFNNAPQSFAYNNGTQRGTVTFNVNDVSMIAPATAGAVTAVPISGNLLATVVTPEPAALLLVGSGMLGLTGTLRRRTRRG